MKDRKCSNEPTYKSKVEVLDIDTKAKRINEMIYSNKSDSGADSDQLKMTKAIRARINQILNKNK